MDEALLELDQIQAQIEPLAVQIRQLVDQQSTVKAAAWVAAIAVPFVVVTPQGEVKIDSITLAGPGVVLTGTAPFLPANFFPWTIVNPPLNADAQGTIDPAGALKAIVLEVTAPTNSGPVVVDPGPVVDLPGV